MKLSPSWKLGIAIALLCIVGTLFAKKVHLNRIEEAEESLSLYEQFSSRRFLALKDSFVILFVRTYPERQNFFRQSFSESLGVRERDTVISYFIFNKNLSYKYFDTTYLSCLYTASEARISSLLAEEAFSKDFGETKRRFPETADLLLNHVGRSVFFPLIPLAEPCSGYFEGQKEATYSPIAMQEFQGFCQQYQNDQRASNRENQREEAKFQRAINQLPPGLSRTTRTQFRTGSDRYFSTTQTGYAYEGNILGVQQYAFQRKAFESGRFENAADAAIRQHYANNSLSHGAMPYSYCFGSQNSCGGYGCSEIRVRASNNSDVLVTIKSGGRVVRHAYIRAGRTYTFQLPNGSYQPFFYYGKGWNPYKIMKSTYCGTLKGGFTSNEVFGKDSPQYLNGDILTYELILRQNGNFSTRPSSAQEAF